MGKLFLEGFVLLFILAGRRAGEAVGPQGNRCPTCRIFNSAALSFC